MSESSYDIVSEINYQELLNAIDQARREITTRFDFKGTDSEIEHTKEDLTLSTSDESKLEQLKDVLHTKLIKRGIALNSLDYGKVEKAGGSRVRQNAKFIAGIDAPTAKIIHQSIKDSKIKVKSQSMDQKVRVTGKSKDDLQKVMKLLKENKDIKIPLQFTNYR